MSAEPASPAPIYRGPIPAWAVAATPRRAIIRGMLVAFDVPGMILLASCCGFGALARDAGVSVGNAMLMMAT